MEQNEETTSFARKEVRDLWTIVNPGISATRGFCSQFNGCSADDFPEHESDAHAAFDDLRTIVHHAYTELEIL